MSAHQYNAPQALEVLQQKLRARDEILAAHVQAAIDAGKDVSKAEPVNGKRRNVRVYRQAVPFTHQEALEVALNALQAYFVEQPLFIETAAEDFAKTAIGVPIERWRTQAMSGKVREPLSLEQEGEEKMIAIELQTTTQMTITGDEVLPLKRMSMERVEEQKRHFVQLRKLMDFTEE